MTIGDGQGGVKPEVRSRKPEHERNAGSEARAGRREVTTRGGCTERRKPEHKQRAGRLATECSRGASIRKGVDETRARATRAHGTKWSKPETIVGLVNAKFPGAGSGYRNITAGPALPLQVCLLPSRFSGPSCRWKRNEFTRVLPRSGDLRSSGVMDDWTHEHRRCRFRFSSAAIRYDERSA